jgi:hypothetical protein
MLPLVKEESEASITTIRVATRDRFTPVSRKTINDVRLSFKARGILIWLLDKPDDWVTSADRIESQGIEGREAVRSALKELEVFGYLVRIKYRDQLGVWRTEWTVYENPRSEPHTGNRQRKAVDGNPSVLIKTETNTETADEEELISTGSFSAPPPELIAQMRGLLKRVK